MEPRGISDHGFIDSIYFRDPNGYVIELAAPKTAAGGAEKIDAHAILGEWQQAKLQ
jgi:catechol-2,3-dioxygenase